MKRLCYTVKEVAELTGQHPNTVRARIKDGTYKIVPRTNGLNSYLILSESFEIRENEDERNE